MLALLVLSAGLLEQLPPQDSMMGQFDRSTLQGLEQQSPLGVSGRPLPGRPAAANPMSAISAATPAAPSTNLQGALRMSMGSLMGFCRCEGTLTLARALL